MLLTDINRLSKRDKKTVADGSTGFCLLPRLLFLCAVLILLVSLTQGSVLSEGDTEYAPISDFTYQVRNKEIYITHYLGSDACVVIPPEIKGMPVVSVYLPVWKTSVNDHSVEKVVLPPTIRELPEKAFNGYVKLTEIDGLENVQSVGTCCFMGCPIKELVFSESLTKLADDAFIGVSTDRLVIPDSIRYQTSSFRIVRVDTIELIQTGSEPTLALRDGMLFSADQTTLLKAADSLAGTFVQIPDTTKIIVQDAFYSQKINEVKIPASVTEIHYDAFRGDNYAFIVYPDSEGLRYVTDLQQRYSSVTNNIECYVVGENETEFITTDRLLQNTVNEIVTAGMSDYEKALALHDWLADHLDYDYSFSCQHTPKEVLKTGNAICQGYADTYAALLSAAGIRNTAAGNYSHAFNAVYIDGAWIFIDCTWDDGINDHFFFGFTKKIKEYTYGAEETVPTYDPGLANAPEYHYWYKMGYMDKLTTAVVSEVTDRLIAGKRNFTVMPNYSLLKSIPDLNVYPVEGDVRPTNRKNIAGFLLADYIEKHVLNDHPDLHCLCDADGMLTVRAASDADNYTYTIQDGGCTILSYMGDETVVTLPALIDGAKVVKIGQSAFSNNLMIEKAILPEGLESIGAFAFSGCENLREIVLPSTLEQISDSAFKQTGLINCDLPEGLQHMGRYVFNSCYKLKTASIPASVGTLSDGTFYHCTTLSSVTLADGLTAIESGCFGECYRLKSVSIPSSVQQIGSGAFQKCLSLEEIVLPEGLNTISNWLFAECESLKSIVIPDTVLTIEDYAFFECKSLTNLVIPKSVKSLGRYRG